MNYPESFYNKEGINSQRSASKIIEILQNFFSPKSVLDVGCGVGSFLKECYDNGVKDIMGIEGEWVKETQLLIPKDKVANCDLTESFDLRRKFDLVLCLEVGEHIDEIYSNQLVSDLIRHADIIAFSAAIPFQHGLHHVNLQWPSYWAEKFSQRGYLPFDIVRWLVWDDFNVASHYRQNLIVYIKKEKIGEYIPKLPEMTNLFTRTPISVVAPDQYESIYHGDALLSKILKFVLRKHNEWLCR